MTYAVAVNIREGLVFVSDSRTNAGADQLSTYSKMHAFCGGGQRFFVLLSAGNLATSQAVVTRLRHDIQNARADNLHTMQTMADTADYVGHVSTEEQRKIRKRNRDTDFSPDASFILGGQIAGGSPRLFLIYPEGNYVYTSKQTPYLQIGEVKYGKPILDRVMTYDLPLEEAARCALVSMDSTMRSNATVGPPIEVLLYPANRFSQGPYMSFSDDDPYLRTLRAAWEANLLEAFKKLPELKYSDAKLRLVDG